VIAGYDPSAIDCRWLAVHANVCHSHDHRLVLVARKFCPGTCPHHCDSEGTNRSVLNDAVFAALHDFRDTLETELFLAPTAIRDIATLPTDRKQRVNRTHAASLLGSSAAFRDQFHKYTNYNQTAALVEILLPDGPTGREGQASLEAIRSIAARSRFAQEPGLNVRVHSDVDIVLDMMAQVFKEAPVLLIGVTTGVTLVIAGLAFRSFLMPLRLLVTVVVTIVIVAGLTAWVYQDVFDEGGIYWIVPLACGCLMIGLSLDYDVFLVSEIYDLRHAGYSTEAAILRAMGTESGTITTAGLIMAIAFSSMLLSSTVVLNQWGLMLVATSLIDTFLVRSVLVPSLLFCFVEWNWWPGRAPTPIYHDYADASPPGAPNLEDEPRQEVACATPTVN